MMETWATSGLDLHLDIGGTRVRAGLESALRDAVRSGRLPAGARLPSSRALAADLGVARNTVADAYGQLVAEGWLAGRPGAGTWVAEGTNRRVEPASEGTPAARAPRFDLRPGEPDVSAFSRRAWLQATRKVLTTAPNDVLSYPDPRGLAELRHALAAYLARTRGAIASAQRIIVCAGFAHGLAMVSDAVVARGATTIAVEAYGHQQHRRLVESAGLRAVPVPVDAHGMVVDALAKEHAALLTPAHQFPLGVALDAQRRRRVVQWAIDHSAVVIEDDYDGEFRYDRQPLGALQALAPDHVIYAGTASKSLAPGLRLGWLVVPAHLYESVLAAKVSMGAFNSSLDQLTLAELINSGAYDRQIRGARLAYRRRRDRLVATLARVPDVWVTGIAAGMHAVVALAPGQREDDVIARGVAQGLALEGLETFSTGAQQHVPSLVIGYGRPPEHAWTTALARLRALLAQVKPPL
jgi:GntR family transcriptional regulator/MocR family aminotransferase